MANQTPRQRARTATEAEIIRIGNQMLDSEGIDGISLRAIARELGIVSSAVYRYVRSRDELLTILIGDAFTSIADTVDRELARQRSVLTLGSTMLDWSRRHSNRWALIYGTPIPNYQAPREATVVPGTRIMVTLADLVAELPAQRPPASVPVKALEPLREGLHELGVSHDDPVIMRTVAVWVAAIGLINALRFGQFGPGFDAVEDDLMRALVATLTD